MLTGGALSSAATVNNCGGKAGNGV
jgi:hypothetical protein